MKLDYGTQLSPAPIKLSVGTLTKPKLIDISALGFDKFSMYEFFLKLTPEIFFKEVPNWDTKDYWNSVSEEQRSNMNLYDIVLQDKMLQGIYLEIFNFFFEESVAFEEGFFIVLNKNVEDISKLSEDDICGVIHDKTFMQILNLMQQICRIDDEEQSIDEMKFKNKTARKLYEKMLKAKKEVKKKGDKNLSIPNIISAVSNRHPSVNPINVWDMTIFQLLDSFNRLQINAIYGIDCTRVSVWGDEKKRFDYSLWYKNEFDNK